MLDELPTQRMSVILPNPLPGLTIQTNTENHDPETERLLMKKGELQKKQGELEDKKIKLEQEGARLQFKLRLAQID
jgi:hypothetical protein